MATGDIPRAPCPCCGTMVNSSLLEEEWTLVSSKGVLEELPSSADEDAEEIFPILTLPGPTFAESVRAMLRRLGVPLKPEDSDVEPH